MADELNRVEAHRQIGQTAVEQLCISAIDDGLGMTQQDLLFMERLQQLIDENMRDEAFSINEVAERVGFSSSSYFAKCFRQKMAYCRRTTPTKSLLHPFRQNQALINNRVPDDCLVRKTIKNS